MSAIQPTRHDPGPTSEDSLRQDLEALGINETEVLTVHSSLSAIGWVIGGAPTVVRALLGSLGETGTLAMPAATPHCADPAAWTDSPVPENWLSEVREHLPVFDPQTTPTEMGLIAETFRNWPGTLRSNHPIESVCANGPLAKEITREHPLSFSEGMGTPFDKLHERDSWILLLGVGFNRCTALHFAESLVEKRRTTTVRFPMMDQDRKTWIEVPNVADDNDRLFPIVGEKYVATRDVRQGLVGAAPATFLNMRRLVEFARAYFESVL